MENEQSNNVKKTKVWYSQQETLLKKWAEVAASYRYLHERSRDVYRKQSILFTMPIIVFSTLTGTANFSVSSVPPDYRETAPLIIGAVNILTGIISTIAQFLRVNEKLESHRLASIAFGKLHRNISVELNLPPKERSSSGKEFLAFCRQEFDRLLEQSPNIPMKVLNEFQKKFDSQPFNKPDILNIEPVSIYEQKPGSNLIPNEPTSPGPSNNNHSNFPSALPSRRNSTQPNQDLSSNKEFEIPDHIESLMKRGPEQIVEGIEKIVPSSRMDDFRKATRVASSLARYLPVSIQKSLPLNVAPSGPENPTIQASFVPLTEIVSLPVPEPQVPPVEPPVPTVEPPVPTVEPPVPTVEPPVPPVEDSNEENEPSASVMNPFSDQTRSERKIDSTPYLEKMHEGVFDIPDDALLC